MGGEVESAALGLPPWVAGLRKWANVTGDPMPTKEPVEADEEPVRASSTADALLDQAGKRLITVLQLDLPAGICILSSCSALQL